MKYPLFITDYDGTLGNFEGIDQGTVEAIKEYEKRGGKFAVCTGRMFLSIRNICLKYGIGGIVVSYQGAMINQTNSGERLFYGKIENSLAADVVKNLIKGVHKPTVLAEDRLYYEETSDYIEYYKKADIVKTVKVKSILSEIESGNVNVLKLNVICDKALVNKTIKEYGEKYKGRLIVNSGGEGLAEFVNPECSKGAAVRFLSKYYKIPYENVITVGDSTNDIELIAGPWHGVAVGDAKEELKKYAKEITVDFKNHPVKFLLEKYCL